MPRMGVPDEGLMFDWFVVTQAAAPDPTWGAGGGTGVTGAPIPASALTGTGKRVLLRSITILQNHDALGVITIFAGDGTTALFNLVIGGNNNSPGHTLDLFLPNGLSVKDVEATPTGSILVAYLLIP
jgi:hypothetical protein